LNIWLTTDWHLGADDDLPKRPRGTSGKIMDRLGMALNPSDLLICLGDIMWNEYDYWSERLSHIECKKWLVIGNHDKKSVNWYMTHGWDWVGESFTLKMFGKTILFSHIPQKDTGDFDVNIHGHFHAFGLDRVKEMEPEIHARLTPKHHLISLEELHFEPIRLQRVIELHERTLK